MKSSDITKSGDGPVSKSSSSKTPPYDAIKDMSKRRAQEEDPGESFKPLPPGLKFRKLGDTSDVSQAKGKEREKTPDIQEQNRNRHQQLHEEKLDARLDGYLAYLEDQMKTA